MLGIPGEDLHGVYSARKFVAWLNGHPDFQKEGFGLDSTVAVVIGQGNVALDVARMLLRRSQELSPTDITSQAHDRLRDSGVREVHIIGRRGPVQAAFTTKEFREILALPNVDTYVADTAMLPDERGLANLDRPKRRLMELIMKLRAPPEKINNENKRLYFHFYRKPVAFEAATQDTKQLGGVELEVTRPATTEPVSDDVVGTGQHVKLPCEIAFRSIGYKSAKMKGVPFDDTKGTVPNNLGRVTSTPNSPTPVPGLYVSGWLKRGPSGIIATNKWDAEETAQCVLADWRELQEQQVTDVTGFTGIQTALSSKGLRTVSFEEWKKIDAEERKRGKEHGKPLEKITVVSDMLDLLLKDIRS